MKENEKEQMATDSVLFARLSVFSRPRFMLSACTQSGHFKTSAQTTVLS